MRLRDDPPPRRRGGRGRSGAERARRLLRAGRLPGRQDVGPAPRRGHEGLARGEPGDDRRVGRLLRRAGQARRSTTPSTSSTAGATTAATRSSACAPPSTRAPRTSRSATRTAPASRTRSPRRPRGRRRARRRASSVGIHTHNDAECGVANSIAGVQAGADLVQGTVNGFGERTGNANLISILPALQLKLGYDCVAPDRLARLTETAHLIDEICNLTPDPDQPYVGRNAFAHKGGLHAAGGRAPTRAPSSTWSRRRSATAARC